MEIKQKKNDERKKFLTLRREFAASERRAEIDSMVCKAIIESASFRYSDILLTYSPVGFEIDVSEVIQEAYRRGKKVAFPKCNAPGQMTFYFCDSTNELIPGFKDIPEPSADNQPYAGEPNALCLVPGLVFDRHGFRIGSGGGYYDRFLSYFTGSSVGVIYSDFLVDSVYKSRFDRSVNALVCEAGIIIPK